MHGRDRRFVTSLLRDIFMPAVVTAMNTPGTHNNSAVCPFSGGRDVLNSGQLIFKYVFSKLFQSKRLLKYDTYMES